MHKQIYQSFPFYGFWIKKKKLWKTQSTSRLFLKNSPIFPSNKFIIFLKKKKAFKNPWYFWNLSDQALYFFPPQMGSQLQTAANLKCYLYYQSGFRFSFLFHSLLSIPVARVTLFGLLRLDLPTLLTLYFSFSWQFSKIIFPEELLITLSSSKRIFGCYSGWGYTDFVD